MAVEQWSKHIIIHQTSEKCINKRFAVVVISVLILFCADVFVWITNPSEQHKIEANGFLSPWDTSQAPPPYLDGSQVKITPRPQVKTQPKVTAVSGEFEDDEVRNAKPDRTKKYQKRWRSSKKTSDKQKNMVANVPIERTTALVQTQDHVDADTGSVR